VALEHKKGPVALILTRQKLPVIDQTKYSSAKNLEKGAYILSDCEGKPDLIFIATGSEVQLAMAAHEKLNKENIKSRVVSMPSWELFEKQKSDYKEKVLPKDVKKRISIEAGSTLGWLKYVTDEGITIGIDEFGKSAPAENLMKEFGFTVENVLVKVKELLK
ncbi:MAG: transketolase, partial [Ignavibacteria bacterium]|nr:transketolase [Ignavibacteria bacterium]